MKGFTLIEILVSVAIFSVVMVIALGSLLALSVADQKAESIKSVTDNLDFAIDSMSRTIRTGYGYGCGAGTGVDCNVTPGTKLVFTAATGASVQYRFENTATDGNAATVCNQPTGTVGCIARSLDNGVTWYAITAPDVVVSNLGFWTFGTAPAPDTVQPKVVIEVSGYVVLNGGATSISQCGTAGYECSQFYLQTTVTQRIYDQ